MKAPKSDLTRRIMSDKEASKDLIKALRRRGNDGTVKLDDKEYRVRSAPKYSPGKQKHSQKRQR